MKNRQDLTHGRYRIIAGTLSGQHKAVALDPQEKKVGEAFGETGVEEAIATLIEQLDELESERAGDRRSVKGTVVASAAEFAHALQSIKLSAAESAMLRAHVSAPGGTMTLAEMAHAAGYRNARTATQRFALLGKKVGESIGLPPPAAGDADEPDFALHLATLDAAADDDGEPRWTLHPELREALQESQLAA